MKPIPIEYKKNGYDFRQFDRTGDVAIYEQIDPETGQIVAYEVFEVLKKKETTIQGNLIEAREATPGNELWGVYGFTVWSIQAANNKAAILQERIENRKKHETSK